ncbi:MAG: hypothetical protein JXI33_07005 [Candidatus Aminicenantes bacterium]|nr:hypothetical protein [Candidatus Aminicenantes bacterium]
MIKKQQKWIALFVALTFIWLMQLSTMPVAAANGPEQIGAANSEQAPNFIEEEGGSMSGAKGKSALPFILIGVGLLTITAVVLVLVVLKNYNIVGTWDISFISITYPGDDLYWDMTFTGTKKSGTFVDSDGLSGTYSISGKNIAYIKYNTISITMTGQFDNKNKISGTYTWTYWDEIGTWSGIRIGSGAVTPRTPSKSKEKKSRELLSK